MKFVDEFRDPALGRAAAGEILSLLEPLAPGVSVLVHADVAIAEVAG